MSRKKSRSRSQAKGDRTNLYDEITTKIIGVLKEFEAGVKTADLARRHGVSEATIYNRKAKYGGLEVSAAEHMDGPVWAATLADFAGHPPVAQPLRNKGGHVSF